MRPSVRPVSLQTRLALRLGIVFAVALLLVVAVLLYEASDRISSLRDRSLAQQAEDVTAALSATPDGGLRLDLPRELRVAYERAGGGYLYVVFDAAGHPVIQYPADAAQRIALAVGRESKPGLFRVDEPGAGTLFGLVRTADRIAPGVRVVVGQGSIHGDVLVDSMIGEFMFEALWLVLIVVLAALAVAVLTIRSIVRPIAATARAAAAIGPHRTDIRLPTDGLPRELLPLVGSTNAALDRLERAFAAQRRFTADAAHQLRTPLAILTARIDALQRDAHPSEDDLAAAGRDVARLNRIVSQMLDVARLDGQPMELTDGVDLRAIAAEAIAATVPLAIQRGIDLALVGVEGPVRVKAAPLWLEMALTNLIENALQHAPAGSCVEVEVSEPPAVAVLNRGEGLGDAEAHTLFEPFRRGRRNRHGGAGLGLAIVKAIALAHGADAVAFDRPGGGAGFRLIFSPVVRTGTDAPSTVRRRETD